MLIERQNEFRFLDVLFAECVRAQGRIALINGAVGSGKTELVSTFVEHKVTGSDAVCLSATGATSERGVSFGVLRQLFSGVPMLDTRALEITRLLDGRSAARGEDAGRPSSRQTTEIASLVCAVLAELAAAAPLVVAVDDVQHADAASIQCLLALAGRMRSARILLLLTEATHDRSMHPSFRIQLLAHRHFHRLRLAPLSEAGVAELLTRHFDDDSARRFAPGYHAITGGNRLLVRALIEDRHDSPEPLVGPCGQPAARETFREAVLACVHRSGTDVLETARGMAILAELSSADRLVRLLDRDERSVARALEAMEAVGLLDAGRRFRDPATRTAVLDDIDAARATELHLFAARLLYEEHAAARGIADHVVAADRVEGDWAAAILRRAAEQALLDDDTATAIGYLELALRGCPPGRSEAALRMLLMRAKFRDTPAAAARHLATLCQAQRDGHLDVDETVMLLRYLLWHGREAAARCLIGWLSSTGEADAQLAGTPNWLRHSHPELSSGMPVAAEPVTGSGASQKHDRQVLAAATLSSVLADGPTEETTGTAKRILQGAPLGDETIEAIDSALQALIYSERLDQALPWCESLLAEASARRVKSWQAIFSARRAEIALRYGALREAGSYARSALTLIGWQGWGVAVGAPLGTLLLVTTATSDYEQARQLLKQPVPEAMFQARYGLHYLYARGRYCLDTGRLHAALADFQSCGELMALWKLDVPALVPWRTDAAEVHLRLGEVDKARHLVRDQLARAGSTASRTHGASMRVLAATGAPRPRLRTLKRTVEVLQACGDRLELVKALFDLSRTHRALGEVAKARMVLHRAGHLARECGVERLGDQLISSQEPPVERAVCSGVPTVEEAIEVLTLSEQKVAGLASLGYTNREIAEKLFVTVSTVEQHLTKVFRKLKVKRRTDLPAELELNATHHTA